MIPRAWLRIIINVLQAVSTLGLAIIGKAWPQTWAGQIPAVIGLAVSGLACQLAMQFVGRRKAVETFLDKLHARSWGKNGGRDPEYRVSFFVARFGALVCYHRTDGHACKRRWSKKPPVGRDGDGLVGYIWQHQLDPNIRALPQMATEDQVKEYQLQTHITADTYRTLSWPGAAVRGWPVEISAAQGPVGVLMVECRTAGVEIVLDRQFQHDATVCGLIWKGWL
jgi:hypothetical protein